MIAFPHAKINLGLNVIRKRADGFHDIESILVPVPLCDALEVVIDDQLPAGAFAYSRTGIPIDGDLSTDLVMRAHALLSTQAVLPGMRAHLHKCIPLGAGLGGGSSDGAFALGMVCDLEANMRRWGAAFYRRAHWEAGTIGQVLYLEAESDGVRGTGIGCFFDDEMRRVLGVDVASGLRTMYHFTVGGPVEDTRLRTLGPYAHLG